MGTDKFILYFYLGSLIPIYAYCSSINMIMTIFFCDAFGVCFADSRLINFVNQSTLLSAADRCNALLLPLFVSLFLITILLHCTAKQIVWAMVWALFDAKENKVLAQERGRAKCLAQSLLIYVSLETSWGIFFLLRCVVLSSSNFVFDLLIRRKQFSALPENEQRRKRKKKNLTRNVLVTTYSLTFGCISRSKQVRLYWKNPSDYVIVLVRTRDVHPNLNLAEKHKHSKVM